MKFLSYSFFLGFLFEITLTFYMLDHHFCRGISWYFSDRAKNLPILCLFFFFNQVDGKPSVAFCHPTYLLRMWGAANLSLTSVWSEQQGRHPWVLSTFQPSLRSVWFPRRMGVLGCRRTEVAQFSFKMAQNGRGLVRYHCRRQQSELFRTGVLLSYRLTVDNCWQKWMILHCVSSLCDSYGHMAFITRFVI